MKRMMVTAMALLMLFCTVCGVSPVRAEETGKEVPAVGETVCGFDVLEEREFPVLGAQIYLMEHQKTGAKVMYIANGDTNRAFQLTFNTRPIDNTGLPHVFEHATVNGSEKYPSPTLFFNLSYQTYNTFMNAFTTDAMTAYPSASLSEAQLLSLCDYYTDSCFHPLIMEDESIYRREAWRYRLESPEDELTLEGTVYSEMLGAMNLERQAMNNANRVTFPGSSLCYDFGGDPDEIPEMTWDDLKEYHDRYYHPSNCVAYLYGDFADYTAFLSLWDGVFSAYEKREFVHEETDYTPITEPVTAEFTFPAEEGVSTEHASEVNYYVVCPGMREDEEKGMIAEELAMLLSAGTSPLQQKLSEALPSGSFAVGVEVAAPEKAFMFAASQINPEDAETFVDIIDSTLREIRDEGFDQDFVDSVVASSHLSNALAGEGTSVGVNIIQSISYSYATSGDPFRYFELIEALENVDDWNREGKFAEAIDEWLLDKETTSLVITSPEPGKREEKEAALREKLAEIKAGMSEEEIAAIVESTNAPAKETDNSPYIAQLQAVTLESLPEEIREYAVADETDERGIRNIDVEAAVDGIGSVSLNLNAEGIPTEQIHYLTLFTDLLGDMDTAEHSWQELNVLIGRYLYSAEMRVAVPDMPEGGFRPMLRIGWISADEDLEDGYALAHELLFDTDFSDTERLKSQITSIKSGLKSTINNGSFNILLYRAMGVANESYRYVSYANYLEYYAFLEAVEQQMEEDPESVIEGLKAVQQYFADHREGSAAGFCGNEKSIGINRALADAFFDEIGDEAVERCDWDLPVPAAREALIVESNVAFNLLYADTETLGIKERDAEAGAVSSIIADTFLVPLLRDQYGVYTPMAGNLEERGMYLLTYRDPNVVETFDVYEQLPDMMEDMELDEETLEGYLMSAYVSYALGQGELTDANVAFLNTLQGKPADRAIDSMKQLKEITPEAVGEYAEVYRTMAGEGIRMTAGGAGIIAANADLYDNILNPFGITDPSQSALTDVEEGDEAYDAVRFAYENGLMAPAGEGLFGAEEDAVLGDLLGALSVAAGAGTNDGAEAVALWAQYGLCAEDDDAGTPLTWEMTEAVFTGFEALAGLPAPDLSAVEDRAAVLTRAELAEVLYGLLGVEEE